MRVLIDLTSVRTAQAGVLRYTEGLTSALASLAPEVDLKRTAAPVPRYRPRERSLIKVWRHLLLLVWFQLVLPVIALVQRADALVCPEYYCPLVCPCPRLVVFYDTLMWDRTEYPWWWKSVLYFNALMPARRGAHVIAISDSMRGPVSSLLNREPSAIRVIYPVIAVGRGRSPSARMFATYGLQPGYLLHVGVLERRKMIPQLILSYGAAFTRGSNRPTLVIAGPRSPIASLDDWDEIVGVIHEHGLTNQVVLLGKVEPALMDDLYEGALAFVFTSRAEGFGMPLAEAMAAGVPVVAVDSPVSREVLGLAGLLVNPDDPVALSSALSRIVADPLLRLSLSQLGLEQAERYTERVAAGELASYLEDVRR